MSDPLPEAVASAPSRPGPRWGRRLLIVWTLVGVVGAWWMLQSGGAAAATTVVRWGPDTSFAERLANGARLLRLNLGPLLAWLFLAPYVFVVALRFPLESGRLRRSVPIHLGMAALALTLTSGWRNQWPQRQTNIMVIRTEEFRETQSPADAAMPQSARPFENSNGYRFETMIVVSNRVDALEAATNCDPAVAGTGVVAVGGPGQLPPGLRELLARTHARAGEEALVAGWLLTNSLAATGKVTRLGGLNPAGLHPRFSQTLRLPGLGVTGRWPELLFDALAYASLAGVAHAFAFHRRYRDRDRRALALESHLAQARLQGLQAQLQPHFLFNTLNGIATLVRRDARAAEEMLTALGELLRLTLHCAERPELPLREELELAGRYLEIQRMRFGGRLQVEQAIDPATLDARVPAMLLQPLVENAIRHGLEPSAAPGRLVLTSAAEAGRLRLEVRDNGLGLGSGPAPTRGSGVGLANLRARLAALYGTEASLELGPVDGGGARVTVWLPWRLEEDNPGRSASSR